MEPSRSPSQFFWEWILLRHNAILISRRVIHRSLDVLAELPQRFCGLDRLFLIVKFIGQTNAGMLGRIFAVIESAPERGHSARKRRFLRGTRRRLEIHLEHDRQLAPQ